MSQPFFASTPYVPLLAITLGISTHYCSAQTNFGDAQIISDQALFATFLHAADLDNDGDNDIVAATRDDDQIAWYRNEGAGIFSEDQIISTDADGAMAVYAIDLDGDGDQDIISESVNDNKLAWYPNKSGGVFGAAEIIGLDGAGFSVHAADMDGDSDNDVLVAFYWQNQIAYYKNLGNYVFSAALITDLDAAWSVLASDLDNDGDNDLLASSMYGETRWYKNSGVFDFSEPQIISTNNCNDAPSPYTVDVDNDGDLDIISSAESYGLAWYANDGLGNFGTQQIISEDVGEFYIYATDLDNDADNDVIVAYNVSADNGDRIKWYENDGAGNFTFANQISANGLNCVYATDLDNDGDKDIAYTAWEENKIIWHQNQQIVSDIETITQSANFNLSTTTLNRTLHLSFEHNTVQNFKLCLYNLQGQLLYSEIFSNLIGINRKTISLANYTQGIYLLQLSNNTHTQCVEITP
jgi:hypothetical protein